MEKESQTFDLQLFAEEDVAAEEAIGGEPSAAEGELSAETDVKSVPYGRFKEVNDKKKEAEGRLAEVEERNRQLEDHFISLQKKEEEPAVEEETFDYENPVSAIRSILQKELRKELPQIIAVETRKQKSIDDARTLFPDLDDDKSEFFRATARTIRRLGLGNHPEGIKIAASMVATTEMPEVFSKMRVANEETRRLREKFVEGDSSRREKGEEYTVSNEQMQTLKAMGLTPKEIQETAHNLATGGGR